MCKSIIAGIIIAACILGLLIGAIIAGSRSPSVRYITRPAQVCALGRTTNDVGWRDLRTGQTFDSLRACPPDSKGR